MAVRMHGYGDQQVHDCGGGHLWRVSKAPATNSSGFARHLAHAQAADLQFLKRPTGVSWAFFSTAYQLCPTLHRAGGGSVAAGDQRVCAGPVRRPLRCIGQRMARLVPALVRVGQPGVGTLLGDRCVAMLQLAARAP